LLACFSFVSHSQTRPAVEPLEIPAVKEVEAKILAEAKQLTFKQEKDSTGRIAKVSIGDATFNVLYDGAGLIDGIESGGEIIKIRMSADGKRSAVLRLFKGDGNELRPIELAKLGLPAAKLKMIESNGLFPSEDHIDLAMFDALERQKHQADVQHMLSMRAARTSNLKFGGGVDGQPITPQPRCVAKCELERDLGLNQCDRENSVRLGVCGVGTLVYSETGPLAVIFGIVCAAASALDLSDCKDDVARRYFNCTASCT
jgi:hypothetical protein